MLSKESIVELLNKGLGNVIDIKYLCEECRTEQVARCEVEEDHMREDIQEFIENNQLYVNDYCGDYECDNLNKYLSDKNIIDIIIKD